MIFSHFHKCLGGDGGGNTIQQGNDSGGGISSSSLDLSAQITRFEDVERFPDISRYAQRIEWNNAVRADAACRIQALFRGASTRWISSSSSSSSCKKQNAITTSSSSSRTTRSKTESNFTYSNGTIVRRKFTSGYHEGEITKYDPVGKYYKITYRDGDTAQMTHHEVILYHKESQQYSNREKKDFFNNNNNDEKENYNKDYNCDEDDDDVNSVFMTQQMNHQQQHHHRDRNKNTSKADQYPTTMPRSTHTTESNITSVSAGKNNPRFTSQRITRAYPDLPELTTFISTSEPGHTIRAPSKPLIRTNETKRKRSKKKAIFSMPKNEEFFFLQDEASNVRKVETTTETQTHQMSPSSSPSLSSNNNKEDDNVGGGSGGGNTIQQGNDSGGGGGISSSSSSSSSSKKQNAIIAASSSSTTSSSVENGRGEKRANSSSSSSSSSSNNKRSSSYSINNNNHNNNNNNNEKENYNKASSSSVENGRGDVGADRGGERDEGINHKKRQRQLSHCGDDDSNKREKTTRSGVPDAAADDKENKDAGITTTGAASTIPSPSDSIISAKPQSTALKRFWVTAPFASTIPSTSDSIIAAKPQSTATVVPRKSMDSDPMSIGSSYLSNRMSVSSEKWVRVWGNPNHRFYRRLIEERYADYARCTDRQQKNDIAQSILDEIKNTHDPIVRFLKQHNDGTELWNEVSPKEACHKILADLKSAKIQQQSNNSNAKSPTNVQQYHSSTTTTTTTAAMSSSNKGSFSNSFNNNSKKDRDKRKGVPEDDGDELRPSKVSLTSSDPFDVDCAGGLLQAQALKRDLKQQLKKFGMSFAGRHGRMPVTAEKEPIRHLYEQYDALKIHIGDMEIDGRRSSSPPSNAIPTNSSGVLPLPVAWSLALDQQRPTAAERRRIVAACRDLRAQITRFEDAFVQLHGRPPKGAVERSPLAATYAQYRVGKGTIRADAACKIQALFRNVRRVETTTKTQTHQMSPQLSKKMHRGKSKRKGPPSPPADEVANAFGTTGVQASSHDTVASALSTINSSFMKNGRSLHCIKWLNIATSSASSMKREDSERSNMLPTRIN